MCGTGPCSCPRPGPPVRTPGRARRRGARPVPRRSSPRPWCTIGSAPRRRAVIALVVGGEGSALSLGAAARTFAGWRSPQLITAAFVLTLAGRIVVGNWSWWDLVVPAAIVAAQPFTEWLIHVFLLHFKPRTVGGRTIDPLVARKHRAHHADPKDAGLVFIPMPALLALVLGLAAVLLLAMPLSRGLSALLGVYAVLFAYEWTHFLIHSLVPSAAPCLSLHLAGPPQPPLPQRALLVRRDHQPGRPRARDVPGPQRGRGVADGTDAWRRGALASRPRGSSGRNDAPRWSSSAVCAFRPLIWRRMGRAPLLDRGMKRIR